MPELTTVSDVKTYLGVTGSGSDTLIGALLDAAEQMIRDRAGRPDGWTQAVFTQVFSGEWSDRLTLRNTPVDLTYGSTAVSVDGLALASTQYSIDAERGIVGLTYGSGSATYSDAPYRRFIPNLFRRRSPNLGDGWRTVTVTYRGGYTTIPASLTMAAKMLTRLLFLDRKSNPAMASESLGNYSYSRVSGEAASIWALVDPFISRELSDTYL